MDPFLWQEEGPVTVPGRFCLCRKTDKRPAKLRHGKRHSNGKLHHRQRQLVYKLVIYIDMHTYKQTYTQRKSAQWKKKSFLVGYNQRDETLRNSLKSHLHRAYVYV